MAMRPEYRRQQDPADLSFFDEAELVHGSVVPTTGPDSGKRFHHAWMESGGYVIDGDVDSSAAKEKVDFQTEFNAEERIRYSLAEAEKMLSHYGFLGPWDLWALHACGPRCLIEMASRNGIPITPAEIVSEFSSKIPYWEENKLGLTTAGDVLDIARQFGIATHMTVSRDWHQIGDLLSKVSGVMVHFEKDVLDGRSVKANHFALNHFALIKSVDLPNIEIFSPASDGTDSERLETIEEFEKRLATCLVLFDD